MSHTHFAILAKYGDTNVPLEKCCEDYFGLALKKALEYARSNELPVPVYRLGSQKSQWFVDAKLLADYIDQQKTKALIEWRKVTGN